MCRETGPSPSHCSLGAGWDAAGGWGAGGFGQHLTGKRLVAVCAGARDAVKFQENGRIGGHSCMGDLDWVRTLTFSCLMSNSPEPRLRLFSVKSMYDIQTSTSHGKMRSVLTSKRRFRNYPLEEDDRRGIAMYKVYQSVALSFLFSPVPFTGCLRAYRFHFTSLPLDAMGTSYGAAAIWDPKGVHTC